MSSNQCYEFRSVPAGTDRIFRTGMQTGTGIAFVLPRVKFRLVSSIPINSGKFRPKCNFVRNEFCLLFFFFFPFFNLRIFFTITCKNILSSTDSILHHSIKYNPKIHNNEVMNIQREREREREGRGLRTRR